MRCSSLICLRLLPLLCYCVIYVRVCYYSVACVFCLFTSVNVLDNSVVILLCSGNLDVVCFLFKFIDLFS